MAGDARPSPAYYFALGLLVIGLVVGASLFLVLATRPGSTKASIDVGSLVPAACPVGGHATTCYSFDLTNTGNGPAFTTCEVNAAAGTQAVFENGEIQTPVNLQEAGVRTVYIRVTPDGGDDLQPPTFSCTTSSV